MRSGFSGGEGGWVGAETFLLNSELFRTQPFKQRRYGQFELRNKFDGYLPNSSMIYKRISVDQYVSKSYNLTKVWDFLSQIRRGFRQSIQGLANNFKLPLHG